MKSFFLKFQSMKVNLTEKNVLVTLYAAFIGPNLYEVKSIIEGKTQGEL